MFTPEQLAIIKYCAEECVRQGKTDPLSTFDMISAWDYATWRTDENDKPKPITVAFIWNIGRQVEPVKNTAYAGFRAGPAFVGDHQGANPEDIDRLLAHLIKAYYEDRLYPDEREALILAQNAEDVFYYEFERIHPFEDGNGRTGKILYNYLLNRMDNPMLPPNFFGSSNP